MPRRFPNSKRVSIDYTILVPPVQGRPLLLYILATNFAFGALLAQCDDQEKERVVYYISRTLVGYELTYTNIEHTCLAIIFASQKLRHYMISHKIQLIAKFDPLKYLLSRSTLIGRLAKWVMVLNEFDIEYVDRKVIKGQIIVDQLAEAPMIDYHPMMIDFPNEAIFVVMAPSNWKLFFYGSYTKHGVGAGIHFIMPQGDSVPQSFWINFSCRNNMAEHEALVIGLHTTL